MRLLYLTAVPQRHSNGPEPPYHYGILRLRGVPGGDRSLATWMGFRKAMLCRAPGVKSTLLVVLFSVFIKNVCS